MYNYRMESKGKNEYSCISEKDDNHSSAGLLIKLQEWNKAFQLHLQLPCIRPRNVVHYVIKLLMVNVTFHLQEEKVRSRSGQIIRILIYKRGKYQIHMVLDGGHSDASRQISRDMCRLFKISQPLPACKYIHIGMYVYIHTMHSNLT